MTQGKEENSFHPRGQTEPSVLKVLMNDECFSPLGTDGRREHRQMVEAQVDRFVIFSRFDGSFLHLNCFHLLFVDVQRGRPNQTDAIFLNSMSH